MANTDDTAAPKLGVNTGNRGKGRPKGRPNKTTTAVKEAIIAAANAAHDDGMLGYLTQQANDNPVAFMTLLGKVIPLQIAGDKENPLQIVISHADSRL